MCKNSELISAIPLKRWLLVFSSKNSRMADEFTQNMIKVSASVGFHIGEPIYVELNDDRKQAFVDAIEKHMGKDVQCVVCILPNANKDRYDAIKQQCSVSNPVPSQCVEAR